MWEKVIGLEVMLILELQVNVCLPRLLNVMYVVVNKTVILFLMKPNKNNHILKIII